jgi:hypothetical protein
MDFFGCTSGVVSFNRKEYVFFFSCCPRIGSMELRPQHLCRPRCILAAWPFSMKPIRQYRCRQASKDAIRHNKKCLWYLSISALIFEKHISRIAKKLKLNRNIYRDILKI